MIEIELKYMKKVLLFFSLVFAIAAQADENPYIAEGTWTNPRTEKSLLMKNFSTNDDALTGRIDVTDYLDYEDPQNIGREYRGAGKYKLHFEVSYIADVDLPTSRLPSS